MQEYQSRVFEEKRELDDKIAYLNLFIVSDTYNSLSKNEHELLEIQLNFMNGYSQVLGKRIANFN